METGFSSLLLGPEFRKLPSWSSGACMTRVLHELSFQSQFREAGLPETGYAIEPLLSASEIEALKGLYSETTPAVLGDFYISALGASVASKRRIFEGIAAIIKGKIARLTPGYRLLLASFVTKRAGSTRGRLGIHQDNSFVNPDESIGINIWVPLSDVDSSNACLRIIEYSQRFGHISATPINPAPYNTVVSELESKYLRDLPMKAGSACMFDSRILHATEENQTRGDRIALYLNLVQETVTPLSYVWNEEEQERLEVYRIDTDFLLDLPTDRPLEESLRARGIFAGNIEYAPANWSLADLRQRLPIPKFSETAATPAVPGSTRDAHSDIWSSLRVGLAGMFGRERRI
jgi:phytanoyl-CoA dioxygenase PhyH